MITEQRIYRDRGIWCHLHTSNQLRDRYRSKKWMNTCTPKSHTTPAKPSATDITSPKLVARRPVRYRIGGSPRIARAIKIRPIPLVTHRMTPNTRLFGLTDIITSSWKDSELHLNHGRDVFENLSPHRFRFANCRF